VYLLCGPFLARGVRVSIPNAIPNDHVGARMLEYSHSPLPCPPHPRVVGALKTEHEPPPSGCHYSPVVINPTWPLDLPMGIGLGFRPPFKARHPCGRRLAKRMGKITSDCPFPDPFFVGQEIFIKQRNEIKYWSDTRPKSFFPVIFFGFLVMESPSKKNTRKRK